MQAEFLKTSDKMNEALKMGISVELCTPLDYKFANELRELGLCKIRRYSNATFAYK